MALYNIARIYKGLYGIIIGYMYTEYTTVFDRRNRPGLRVLRLVTVMVAFRNGLPGGSSATAAPSRRRLGA